MKKLSLDLVYRFIEPGPVLLLNTFDGKKPNTMAASYHMMVEDGDTPLVAVMLGSWDYSLEVLTATGECVLSVPTFSMVEKVVSLGNSSGSETDKFKEFSLTTKKAAQVKAPLIKECLANFECVLKEQLPHFGMNILEVVAAWTEDRVKDKRLIHHNGNGTFTASGETVDLKHLMTRYPSYTR
jgi:flavin reductase (DIM6/NTAB) family NADH-FMN oxidoreductase RutF